jgi:hypothetical protein
MALAELTVVPQTPDDVKNWSFSHMANHLDIIRRIQEVNKISLNAFPLDPIDPGNLGQWLYQHAVMHAQMDLVLGIAGYDLLDLDWRDPDQLAEWIGFNADEHVQAGRILGIA